MSKNFFANWTPAMIAEHNRIVMAGKLGQGKAEIIDVSRNNARYAIEAYPHPIRTFNPDEYEKNSVYLTIPLKPKGAVRMNRSVKWTRTKSQAEYLAFQEQVRFFLKDRMPMLVPDQMDVIFWIPTPDSPSIKDWSERVGMPHRFTPDTDNLVKAIKDSIWKQDCGIWKESAEKFWCKPGHERIELRLVYWKKVA